MSHSADSAQVVDDARWLAFVEPLRAFLRRRVPAGVEVDDVAQDVFLRLARHRATMADVRDLDAWVFRVARAALTDAWRAERRRSLRSSDLDPDSLVADDLDGDAAVGNADDGPEVRAKISSCVKPFVAALTPAHRRALELTTVHGLTQEEAARQEGISLSGMKSRVQRARATVLREIQLCCGLERDARGVVQSVGPAANGACPPPASFHQIQRLRK